nr:hypothetical protein [Bacteroidota bacterium]
MVYEILHENNLCSYPEMNNALVKSNLNLTGKRSSFPRPGFGREIEVDKFSE